MKYKIKFTSQFRKDIKRSKKQGKDLNKLFNVIESIARGNSLDKIYKDHELKGIYKGTRECHIDPDWLLIYEINEEFLVLMLIRVGSHSNLFK
ncbi:type II toxin-antitoxin system YafQ family toxin [Helcococcus kunzii]|uniref:type II toxin-antitoxin system YafQ family toxin n=1 Tax=Helcococcus kunzii TaxID=40091 RepID=UPI0024AE21A6|nr:type II toxin-antitoxin system YafQ family toxin [Helcococcus kunzii]